jgi:hypothetical protein
MVLFVAMFVVAMWALRIGPCGSGFADHAVQIIR